VVWHNEILMMSLARSKADQCSYSPSAGNMPDRRPVLADAMCIYFLLWWLGRKSTWCFTLMRTFRRVFLVKKLDDFSTHTHTHTTRSLHPLHLRPDWVCYWERKELERLFLLSLHLLIGGKEWCVQLPSIHLIITFI